MTIDSKEKYRERLLDLLKKKSFSKRKVILASGRESDFYIDCRNVSLTAEGMFLIGQVIFDIISKIKAPIAAIGGPTLGADPIVSAVSYTSYMEQKPLEAFIIRKEPKGHGTGQWIEGLNSIPKGSNVIIVEDVVTTGESAIKAVKHAEEAELKVVKIIALVDREEGGRERVEKEGYELETLYRRTQFFE